VTTPTPQDTNSGKESKYRKLFKQRPDGNYEFRFSFAVVLAPEFFNCDDFHTIKDEVEERGNELWENCRLTFLKQMQDARAGRKEPTPND
jgi:hypothetical protein